MKVSFPLSLKVSLWLLANLLLLAAVGGGFYVSQFGVGWISLTHGVLGDQLQSIGDSIASDLQAEPEGVRPAIIASRSRDYGADFFLFTNEGSLIAGDKVDLPPSVRELLVRGQRRGDSGPDGPPPPRGRPPRGEGSRGPRPADGASKEGLQPADNQPPPNRRAQGAGKFIIRTADPTATWIGLRVPIKVGFGPPTPGTVIIRTESLWTLARLLRLGPGLAVGAGALLLSLLFWLPLVGSITRSLTRLNRATERIAEGEFSTRVELSRRDEIGHLGHSVNRMAERLDTLVNGQKRFLGDVAHELGSPLGRLQVATEILESRADPALRPHVADVREEVQHMAALVNELLAFTKAGLRPRDVHQAPVALTPLVQRMLAREDAQRVTADLAADLTVLADPELLERALANLVRNALRYAPTGPITLAAQASGAVIKITVADAGPGVPIEALARLGEPFYRPDSARNQEAGGTGLGLAIVRSAITACGGTVVFRNRHPHGLETEITLGSPEPFTRP
jgi:two-component system sensor histidine kinase CpxA